MTEAMTLSAVSALQHVLSLREGENFLAITDEEKLPIGEAFLAAAKRLGANAGLFVLPGDGRPLSELPEGLAEAIGPAVVVVNCFSAFAEETPFRINLIRRLADGKRRVGHAPGITEDMMVGGPMDVDFGAIQEKATALIASLRNASYARVTAPGGTDITLYIEGRAFDTDVAIGPGGLGNLPCGEIWCAPVETLGEGVLVCDGSIGDLGAVPEPVTITIDQGRVQRVVCPDDAFKGRVEKLLSIDDEAKVVGEFGIGINPGARLTGNLLEDEKAFRTAHVAFGNNEEMPGGRNHSRTHRDFLFKEPTIRVHYADGSAVVIVEDGLARL